MALAHTLYAAQELVPENVAASYTSIPANSLLIIHTDVEAQTVPAGDASTMMTISSSPSLTWTQRAELFIPGGGQGGKIWTAPFAAGGSIDITLGAGGNTWYFSIQKLIAVTGAHATPVGATSSFGSTYSGAGSVTLNAAPATTSFVYGFNTMVSSGSANATEGAGMTELYDNAAPTANYNGIQGQYRTGSTSTSVPWADTNVTTPIYARQFAMEIIAAAGGNLRMMNHYA